jgi:hypothetical protein
MLTTQIVPTFAGASLGMSAKLLAAAARLPIGDRRLRPIGHLTDRPSAQAMTSCSEFYLTLGHAISREEFSRLGVQISLCPINFFRALAPI